MVVGEEDEDQVCHSGSEQYGGRIDTIPGDTLNAMQCYAWPGNIRELRNVIERAVITSKGRTLVVELPEVPNNKICLSVLAH